jgi:hypothetical protein
LTEIAGPAYHPPRRDFPAGSIALTIAPVAPNRNCPFAVSLIQARRLIVLRRTIGVFTTKRFLLKQRAGRLGRAFADIASAAEGKSRFDGTYNA